MATITFENGTKVKFDGNPTPQDVEEVAQKLKLSSTPAPTPTPAPASTPTSLGSKVKTAVGAAGSGLGAKLPLMGIDYVGRKIVDNAPTLGVPKLEQLKSTAQSNLAKAPKLTEQYDKNFDVDKNPITAKVAEYGTGAASLLTGLGQVKEAIKRTPAIAEKMAASTAGNASKAAGEIVQGDIGDIDTAIGALSGIKSKGVKKYKDLVRELDSKITQGSQLLDGVLNTSSQTKKLGELGYKTKIGTQDVTHNFVDDSIGQLREYYAKTNDIENLAKMNQLKDKAENTGLTIKEINDLARQHGRDLNAFNANGQLASGLSKQAAENTRTGLKSTARDLFGDKIYKNADEQLSKLIRTRKLVADMAEKVNDLEQKIQTRGLGEKAGRLFGQAVNLVGMNGPKGLVEYFLGRGTGLKTMNALDLEKKLQGNLKQLQKVVEGNPNASEADIIKQLESFLKNNK